MDILKKINKILRIAFIPVMIAYGYFLLFDYFSPWTEILRPTFFGILALGYLLLFVTESENRFWSLFYAIGCTFMVIVDLFK